MNKTAHANQIKCDRPRGFFARATSRMNLELAHCVVTRPRLCARDTACARRSTPSLPKTFLRCDFTVSGPM
jgi:hypothetical protein